MIEVGIADAGESDFERIIVLNHSQVQHTSELDLARLRQLHEQASYHRVVRVGQCFAGFLLALREGADYDSANYRWFAARHPTFAYIDRIVISPERAGHGLGRALYQDLFAQARHWGIERICCEYNLQPANPPSAAFHRRLGFVEVGQQALDNGKRVSMQVLTMDGGAAM